MESSATVKESARSMFEIAGEHWATSHRDVLEPIKFKLKVVASFQDSLTRQISESVRIDLRGAGILNSKTEYSRCRLPRLVIDQEECRLMKKTEVKELEKLEEELKNETEDTRTQG